MFFDVHTPQGMYVANRKLRQAWNLMVAQTTPRRGVVYSLCAKRGIPGDQICLSCPSDAPLLRSGQRTVHTGTGKGAGLGVRFRACESSRQGA